jgi:membrane protein implicated in regulation of membrane protease activity
MFRFLPGVILVQIITAGLVVIAFQWGGDLQLVVVIVSFAFIVGLLAAFWFSASARDTYSEALTRMRDEYNDALARLQEDNARKREDLLISAEREKAAFFAHSVQRIEKETRRAHAKANFKVGVAVTAAAGAGAAMLMTQFVTVGLMILVASGSALSGYLMRAQHERLAQKRQRTTIDEAKEIEDQRDSTTVRMLEKE